MEKVADLMTEDPIVAELPNNRRKVINLMIKNEITGVPVVKDGVLKGFVSRHDFFNNPEEEQLAMVYKHDYPVLSKDDDLEEAARIFVEENIHYIPVKENGDQCVGIITTADMLEYIEEVKPDVTVGEAARRPCVPIYEDTPIKVVLQAMKLTGLYAFPVVDGDAMLTGIITDRDLFDLSEVNGEIVISELGLGDDEDSWSWKGLRNIMKLYYEESKIELPDIRAKDAMVGGPKVVFDQTKADEAAKIMRRNDYGQLPIVDEMDKLETMVYELDLIAAIV